MSRTTKLTPFGIELKKARIDADETQAMLAKSLNVSTAFISGIETGVKKIPDGFVSKLIGHYNSQGVILSDRLHILAAVSNGHVSLSGLSAEQQMLVTRLAHMELTDQQCEKLKQEFNL